MISPENHAAFDRLEKLLLFPTIFPLKVMGVKVENFQAEIIVLVRTYIPEFDASSVEVRNSTKGAYQSLTLNLKVTSRLELEAIYDAVSTHPLVKIVL
jgi:uncharacterized protein